MKLTNALRLGGAVAIVAALGLGCASTATARYDTDSSEGMGASAGTEVGADRHVMHSDEMHLEQGLTTALPDTEGADRITVSALSFTPETRATWVNRFPFYDNSRQLAAMEVYTLTPEEEFEAGAQTEFRADLPEGAAYVEAAGGVGAGERVIQHSPNPIR